MFSVMCWRNGSSMAVLGSGMRSMSDSWICWNPRIEEPSNISPSVKVFSSKLSTGTVKCWTVPGRSQNRTSTNSTFWSPMNFSTSPAFVNINPPWAVRALSLRTGVPATGPPRTLGARGFRPVSRVFHACYGMPAGRRAPATHGWALAPPGDHVRLRAVVRVIRQPRPEGLMADAAPYRQDEPPRNEPAHRAGGQQQRGNPTNDHIQDQQEGRNQGEQEQRQAGQGEPAGDPDEMVLEPPAVD